jgi:basic membrane protein A
MRVAGLLFGAPNAGSFVTLGARGFERAARSLPIELDLVWVTEKSEAARQAILESVAAARPDLIVLHGAQGEEIARTMAPRHPSIFFSVSQGGVAGEPNLASYEVLLEQAAYLAGALAGKLTVTGMVGHLSGERVRAGLKGRAAFAAGLVHGAAGTRLLSSFCGDQHDPSLAHEFVCAQADAGVDLIFTMLGRGREGAIRACRERVLRQIGDGADWCAQEPDVFVASVVADAGWGVYRAIADVVERRFEAGRVVSVGLDSPQVCRLSMAAAVGPALVAEIESLAAAIVAGEIAIPATWEGGEFQPPSAGAARA